MIPGATLANEGVSMSCTNCEAPTRLVWPANRGTRREFCELGHMGYWTMPIECAACGAIWIRVAHEPFASFTYDVLWQYSIGDWIRLHDTDRERFGQVVLEWHNAIVQEEGIKMLKRDDADAAAIRSHDSRLGGHGPIIRGRRPIPDLDALLGKAR